MVGGLVDTFYHTLDPKKRLTIPSEWRDAMGMEVGEKDAHEYVYVFPNESEDCLDLVPVREMQNLLADLSRTDILENDPIATALAQSAQMLKVDSAGRIRIGDEFLAHAGIKNGVTMIGGMRKATLWAVERKPAPPAGKLDLTEFRAVVASRSG